MNVYDCANELARAMRESHEFKKLKEANEILDKDPETKKLVNE
ncbi:MAG: YlbF family regulator, partial [Phascolarctobacterium sp.]|nr:YlbF family regulator [Phascolarctobacterium sp.]